MKPFAMCLLAVIVARHYAWDIAPAHLAGVASKMLGAFEALFLIAVIAYAYREHMAVWLVACYGAWEHAQTAICSWAFLVQPWTLEPGQPMCSQALVFELGAVGIAMAAALLYRLNLSELTGSKVTNGNENE